MCLLWFHITCFSLSVSLLSCYLINPVFIYNLIFKLSLLSTSFLDSLFLPAALCLDFLSICLVLDFCRLPTGFVCLLNLTSLLFLFCCLINSELFKPCLGICIGSSSQCSEHQLWQYTLAHEWTHRLFQIFIWSSKLACIIFLACHFSYRAGLDSWLFRLL